MPAAILRKSFIIILLLLFSASVIAQSQPDEEVSVYLNVQRIGSVEIPSIIQGQTIYLPVSEVFDFLKIANTPSAGRDSLSGFFITQQSTYLIDNTHHLIRFKDKTYPLKSGDLIKTATSLYLNISYFDQIFDLQCVFSFRNLSVTMSTNLELPVMREMRQAEMRGNIGQLKGEMKVDTTVKRTYPLLHFGMADWSVISTQEAQSAPDTRLTLGLGGLIAGGETNISINYHINERLQERNQYYLWRLANNDSRFFKQIMAGKIFGQSTASIYAPIVGVQLTNTPTTYRRSFGTYTLSNITQPNWIVELYVNNALINYVRADASGYYTFEVPLVYGNSSIKLRFYGPSGEERSVEQNISIPFNFLPKNEFEYTASAGIVEDGTRTRFSRLSANYGLARFLTIGAGTEYLSSVTSGKNMPFVNSSARLFNNLLLSGEYTYGVRTKGVMTYRFTSGLQLELNDTWYKKGQTAINNTFLEERKAILSIPVHGRNFSAYTRITINQLILPATRYTTAEWLISGVIWNMNANINTYALFTSQTSAQLYSNFSITNRLLKTLRLTQQIQYAYKSNKIVSYKEELEHVFFKNGFLTASYENNILSHIQSVELGIRYDFSFAQTSASVRRTNQSTRYVQAANGSIIADQAAGYTSFLNHTSVGKGGIIVVPFLDLNANGKKDAGEPKAAGLKLSGNGGHIIQNTRDTTITITDLEAYTNYTMELDPAGFDNISWQLRKHVFSVAVDPNKMKVVEVPVTVSGEVSGRVKLKTLQQQKGQGRMIICIYKDQKIVARTVTETDGYFSYLGLPPGDYTAQPDPVQLLRLNLKSVPGSLKFTIKKSIEGGIADGLEFILN